MKYEEMINKLEEVRRNAETKYLDEISEHIFIGISRWGYVDLVLDGCRKDIRAHDWNFSYDILMPQKVYFLIRDKLKENFSISNIRCEVYRLTLK